MTMLPKGANGTLTLKLGPWGLWQTVTLAGGPFVLRTADHFGVCLLEREHPGSDVWLPIDDFSVPRSTAATTDALKATLTALLEGQKVWVGCMGGFGRTGLFLALLARAAGCETPIAHVRETYCKRAVETREQEQYVELFPLDGLDWWLLKTAFKARLDRLLRRGPEHRAA